MKEIFIEKELTEGGCMNTKSIKVSVIIPTYRRPQYLSRAINSVLSNTWNNVEIIVVDDNANGDEYRVETERVMSGYLNQNNNVIYLKHEFNKNGSAARNTGIKKATGKYVMFLDDDDEFFSEKIASQVEFMESCQTKIGACYTRYVDVNSKDKIVSRSGENLSGNLLINELGRNLYIHAGSNLMIRTNVVREINGFDESFLRNQDQEFLTRLLKRYEIGYVDMLGLKVHIHKGKTIDFDKQTDQYIASFKNDIDELSMKDQKKVYMLLSLQRWKYYLSHRRYKKAINQMRIDRIPCLVLLRYIFYLARRKVCRLSYGFPLEHIR